MGLFTSTYSVEYNMGFIIPHWKTVIKNLDLKEAERYVAEKTSGLFSENKSKYRIIKE
ncbi:hypothetical protein [Enterococcus mundtii]|uniref:hypothetical protein n=1 Tax=Enterococcus mundtii TaxID=53346 RepID=UPI0015C3CDED|nr:hypothetical protein [Enterococcus mundtii]